ncbi:hypothetical protein ACVW00_000021 [Marmoricola sp. URHA0025 HA25]
MLGYPSRLVWQTPNRWMWDVPKLRAIACFKSDG